MLATVATFAGEAAAEPIGWLHALLLGVVEGVTEFLPVSSTGHLIVTNALLGRSDPAMEVAIQAGAITAIAVLYRQPLWQAARGLVRRTDGAAPRRNLLVLLVLAALPAAVLGLLCEDVIESYLFGTLTVALGLLVGGVLLWWLEVWLRRRDRGDVRTVADMTARDALLVGLFQCLALVPGTSRAGATIAGALVLGYARPAAAEFSFLVGLPILYGASLLKLSHDYERLTGPLLADFLVASVAAFATALVIVGPFVGFLRRHTFVPFAVYRIAFGALLLALVAGGVLPAR